jgi:hypothetical protein
VKRKLKSEYDSLKDVYGVIKYSYRDYHGSDGKINIYYEELKKKYPGKIKVFSKRDINEYLKELRME